MAQILMVKQVQRFFFLGCKLIGKVLLGLFHVTSVHCLATTVAGFNPGALPGDLVTTMARLCLKAQEGAQRE